MATFSVSKAGWNALSTKEQNIFRHVSERVGLGNPAIYVDAGSNRHFTFHDSRIRPLDFAVIGCYAANRADLPAGYTIPTDGEGNVDKAQLRADIVAWITSPSRTTPFVHPDDVTPSDPDVGVTDDEILAANGAPAALRASLDPTWVPYDPETHGAV